MDKESAIFFRDQFRAGRATALHDAEGFQEILFTLERLGAFLSEEILDLRKYKNKIQEKVAKGSPLAEDVPKQWDEYHLTFSVLYELVREARNDALHQGAFARHLTGHAVELALILEDALMNEAITVDDYMVREPTYASVWQPISFVRQQMLEKSYSNIPILLKKDNQLIWHLLSDTNIVKYLGSERSERKKRLAKTVREALDSSELHVEEAKCYPSQTCVSEVLKNFKGKPILVVAKEQPDRLLGILTAFDLL